MGLHDPLHTTNPVAQKAGGTLAISPAEPAQVQIPGIVLPTGSDRVLTPEEAA